MAQAPLPPIKFAELAAALLADARNVVAKWLPGGKFDGHEYKCGNLTGGAGRSCSVNVNTGAWGDFATGEQGVDLLSLYKAMHGFTTMAEAALQVADEEGLEQVAGIVRRPGAKRPERKPAPARAPAPPKPPAPDEKWRTVSPVPDNAPAPTFRHHHRKHEDIVHQAEYRHGDVLHGYVVRFRTSDGGKETLPYTYCLSERDGACKWSWRQWDEPRPLYFPGHELPAGRTIVLVEGEKKGDALQQLLDAGAPGVYCVATWPGGCKAWKKAEWVPLAGLHVIAWPDCDAKREPLTAAERKETPDKAAQAVIQQGKPLLPEKKQPGMAAMLAIGAMLRDTHGCTVQLLPIPKPGEVADGWDCGDAIAEGWDFDRVSAFLASAFALPSDAQAPATSTDGGGGKKIDGPAGAGMTDSRGRPIPWWLEPYWNEKDKKWMVSRKLVIAALTYDDDLKDVLSLNMLSNNIEARNAWPWASKPRPVTGADDLLLGQYLSQTYGLPSISRAALSEAIETVAHGRQWHPIREYLEGLEWDNVSRLDKWLIHALGETPDTLLTLPGGRALTDYLVLVGRFWILGMVNRVMEPGCKFDYCPVLEGPGGLRKSTLVETLAGTAYFSDTHFDVSRGKEGQEQVQGLWCYEIAELAGFGRAEVELIKAFITAKVDRYRPSYGKVVESFPRQCLLAGTTNNKKYLRDRTGNRRFWPIPVRNRINIPWVQKWRDQLMAEAFVCYREGVPFVPTPEDEERLFVPMQEQRVVDTAVTSELLHVLTRDPSPTGIGAEVNNLTDFVTMGQLTRALGVDAAKSSAALETQIRGWLEHEGWEHQRKMIQGSRQWGYGRPRDWPPQEEPDPPASSNQGAPDEGAPVTTGSADDDPF